MDLTLICLIVLLVAVICAAAIACYRYFSKRSGATIPWRDWRDAAAIIAAILALDAWLDERDARQLAQMLADIRIAELIEAGYLHPDRALLPVDLNQCPPRIPGTTDLVQIVIATQADGGHVYHGCTRIAERMLQPKAPAIVVAGP